MDNGNETQEGIACAHTTCRNDALVAFMINGHRAPICREHYLRHTLRDAHAFTANLGLKTVAEMREWVRVNPLQSPPSKAWAHRLRERQQRGEKLLLAQVSMMESALNARPLRVREPGDDDDEPMMDAA